MKLFQLLLMILKKSIKNCCEIDIEFKFLEIANNQSKVVEKLVIKK